MSDNRFKDCETAEGVLLSYSQIYDQNPQTRADALARIAELTPRTVDEAGRERARRVMHDWINDGSLGRLVARSDGETLLDEIIAALGWQAAPAPESDHGGGAPTPAPATPAVELDLTALDHIRGVLARYENLRAAMVDQPMFGDMPDITIPGDLPMRITMDDNGVSVLRIGGDQ